MGAGRGAYRGELPPVAPRYRTLLLAAAVAAPLVLTAACGGAGNPGPSAAALAAAPGPAGTGVPAAPGPQPGGADRNRQHVVFPLLHAWAGAYQQQFPQVAHQLLTAPGSGTGIKGRVGGHGGHRRLGRLPVQRRPGQEPGPAEHPAGRGGPAGGLQPARVSGPACTSGWTGAVLAQMYQGTIPDLERPGHPGGSTPESRCPPERGRAAAPVGLLRRHVPVHQLPVHP